MVQPTVPRENRKMLALPEDQIFISILCVSALIPGGGLVQFLQQSRCKSCWYRKSERRAVGTALLQQEGERSCLRRRLRCLRGNSWCEQIEGSSSQRNLWHQITADHNHSIKIKITSVQQKIAFKSFEQTRPVQNNIKLGECLSQEFDQFGKDKKVFECKERAGRFVNCLIWPRIPA